MKKILKKMIMIQKKNSNKVKRFISKKNSNKGNKMFN